MEEGVGFGTIVLGPSPMGHIAVTLVGQVSLPSSEKGVLKPEPVS